MPHGYSIQNGEVVLPDRTISGGTVLFQKGNIQYAGTAKKTPRGYQEIDAKKGYVTPGLMDVHIHGAGQYGFEDPQPEAFFGIANILAKNGILRFVPTLMASETIVTHLTKILEQPNTRRAMGDMVPGLYLEGPFINSEKRGGIQSKFVRPVDVRHLKQLQKIACGNIRMMTFAPELTHAEKILPIMKRLGILPCAGHSLATAEQAKTVCGRETINTTHLFNAMSGLDHKTPGLAAFVLNEPQVWVEVNPDGLHVAPELLRLAYHAKQPYRKELRLVLISDAVISAGRPEGEYDYMGTTVVAKGTGVRYKKTGTLIGSRVLLNEGVGRMIRFSGASVEDAVRMATLNPARMLGLSRKIGSLESGKQADIVIFSRCFRSARAVWQGGTLLHIQSNM